MAKYTKLIGTIIFTLITFSVYSISQGQNSTNQTLTLSTIEGDPSYIDDLYLAGYAFTNTDSADPSFVYQNGDFTFLEELSFLDKIDYSTNPLINKIKDKHASFLRGKSPYATFEENKERIIYASSRSDIYWSKSTVNQLSVSVLEKSTNKETTGVFSLPDNLQKSDFMNLRDVYITYPKIYFTVGTSNPSTNTEALSVLSVDLEDSEPKLKLVREFDSEFNDTNNGNYTGLSTSNSRYLNLNSTYYSDEGEPTVSKMALYDYSEDKILDIPDLEKLSSPAVLKAEDGLYIADAAEHGYTIYKADTAKSPVALSKITEISGSAESSTLYPTFIFKDSLYSYEEIYVDKNSTSFIQTNDLETGELTYRGELTSNNKKAENVYFSLTEFEVSE